MISHSLIYFDNAATTPLDDEVLEVMMPFMRNQFGNPSSIHTHGREARAAIEKARKTIAGLLQTSPSEIFFTSGGTEADNTAIRCGIEAYKIRHAITSPIEHHAVLHTLKSMEHKGEIELSYVETDARGAISYEHLQSILYTKPDSLVSLMHANNEIGNLNDIGLIGNLCREAKSIFHSDCVQTMGHYVHNIGDMNIDFIAGSAHKFHGPKGAGFLYVNGDKKINPLIHGGAQERNLRGGTENVYGIVGMAKALEIAYTNMEKHRFHIQNLKTRMMEKMSEKIPGVMFNGLTAPEQSLYTILNVNLPESDDNDMLLFNLDINKICASGGSACSSGTDIGSHVLNFLNVNPRRGHVRFSFSKYNTPDEVDYVVDTLANLFVQK